MNDVQTKIKELTDMGYKVSPPRDVATVSFKKPCVIICNAEIDVPSYFFDKDGKQLVSKETMLDYINVHRDEVDLTNELVVEQDVEDGDVVTCINDSFDFEFKKIN